MSETIGHISGTALLVAAARTAESAMEDGLVRDPYAAQLAGERGMAIARAGVAPRWRSFGIGLRTRFMDELLSAELEAGGVDCVLSLGAGLDARPWRRNLPSALCWIEVDFAPILDYKHGILKDLAPHCRLERMVADINQEQDRRRVIETALQSSRRVLLLTEGLLFYLPAETVRRLTREAVGCHRWLLDVSPQTSLLLSFGGDSMRRAMELRHETRLEGPAILDAVRAGGWAATATKTFMKDGAPFAVQRIQRDGITPDPNAPRPSPDDPAGVWMFERRP